MQFDPTLYVITDSTYHTTETLLRAVDEACRGGATLIQLREKDKGRRLRIFYMTQASTCPPTFVCFCNDARLFHFSYQRYLENQIREVFGLTGTPVRMVIRERSDKSQ